MLVHLNELVVLQVLGGGVLDRKDHQHGFVEVGLELLLETQQIKRVPHEVLVNLNKEVVVLQIAKPTDPAFPGGLLSEDRCFLLRWERADSVLDLN